MTTISFVYSYRTISHNEYPIIAPRTPTFQTARFLAQNKMKSSHTVYQPKRWKLDEQSRSQLQSRRKCRDVISQESQ